jgi:hypothetical protein
MEGIKGLFSPVSRAKRNAFCQERPGTAILVEA